MNITGATTIKSLEILINDKKGLLKNYDGADEYLTYVEDNTYSLYFLYKEEGMTKILEHLVNLIQKERENYWDIATCDCDGTINKTYFTGYDFNLVSLERILTKLYNLNKFCKDKSDLAKIILWLRDIVYQHVGYFDDTLAYYHIEITIDCDDGINGIQTITGKLKEGV